MRWLLDENVPTMIGRVLREGGHDVVLVSDIAPGMTDSDVLARAREENRVLASFDRDHGDLIFARGEVAPRAVVYLRLDNPSPENVSMLARALVALELDLIDGHFNVITLSGIRQRALPQST